MSAPPRDAAESPTQASPPSGSPPSPSRPLVTAYYVVLAVVTAAVVAFSAAAGSKKHAEPTVAGGYDVTGGVSCLGSSFDLAQSGQFVDLTNPQGTLSGTLTLKSGRLTGTVNCLDHTKAPIQTSFSNGNLVGTIGPTAMAAQLKRDPPPAGSPKPRAPASISGTYGLSPSSACLGTTVI